MDEPAGSNFAGTCEEAQKAAAGMQKKRGTDRVAGLDWLDD